MPCLDIVAALCGPYRRTVDCAKQAMAAELPGVGWYNASMLDPYYPAVVVRQIYVSSGVGQGPHTAVNCLTWNFCIYGLCGIAPIPGS